MTMPAAIFAFFVILFVGITFNKAISNAAHDSLHAQEKMEIEQ